MEMTPRNGGTVTDVNYANDLIHDAVGGISMIRHQGLYPVSAPLLRFRVANNLIYNIDGGVAHQATVQAGFPGVGWATSAGFAREDTILERNTFYSIVGGQPSFQDLTWTTTEGFSATNNLIWTGTGNNRYDVSRK